LADDRLGVDGELLVLHRIDRDAHSVFQVVNIQGVGALGRGVHDAVARGQVEKRDTLLDRQSCAGRLVGPDVVNVDHDVPQHLRGSLGLGALVLQ